MEKSVYEAIDIHNVIFIKNLLDFSDDYARSVAKNEFWYLDTDTTTVTADAATNTGIRARGLIAHEGNTVETLVPLTDTFSSSGGQPAHASDTFGV